MSEEDFKKKGYHSKSEMRRIEIMKESNKKPREWTLRIHSNNDGGGYIYSGDDVEYPKDDYLEVIEKSAYEQVKKQLEIAKKAIKNRAHVPNVAYRRLV